MADNFPGFRLETIVDESGWGAAVSRDDIRMEGGRRGTFFSRLQFVVSPYNTYHVSISPRKAPCGTKKC